MSEKGKAEGRETTDTKTTSEGRVHLPATFTLHFEVSAPFLLGFPGHFSSFSSCLISSNFFPFSPFDNPHLPGTLAFPASRTPPLYYPWAPTPLSSPTSVWNRKFKNGIKMGKYLHRITDFYRCTCYWLLNIYAMLNSILIDRSWTVGMGTVNSLMAASLDFSCFDDTNSCPLNSTDSLRMSVRTPRLWFN